MVILTASSICCQWFDVGFVLASSLLLSPQKICHWWGWGGVQIFTELCIHNGMPQRWSDLYKLYWKTEKLTGHKTLSMWCGISDQLRTHIFVEVRNVSWQLLRWLHVEGASLLCLLSGQLWVAPWTPYSLCIPTFLIGIPSSVDSLPVVDVSGWFCEWFLLCFAMFLWCQSTCLTYSLGLEEKSAGGSGRPAWGHQLSAARPPTCHTARTEDL